MEERPRPYSHIRAICRDQWHHLEPFLEGLSLPVVRDERWEPGPIHNCPPALLITLCDDSFESYNCVRAARAVASPSVLFMDGILEWRHQYENPMFGAGGGTPYRQSSQVDKIACLGHQSKRLLESWGNAGRCEVVGAPRMDALAARSWSPVPGQRILLVMTANKPAFTPEQMAGVERALVDIRTELAGEPRVRVAWRVRGGLGERLGLMDDVEGLRRLPLSEILNRVDAVLCTPSTAILEAMLAGRPTAMLDYSNSPPFIGTAWAITAKDHIRPTAEALLAPSGTRMAYQRFLLEDALACATPAAPRATALCEALIHLAAEARAAGRPLAFPSTILPEDLPGKTEGELDLAEIYPRHPVFSDSDIQSLRVRLHHALRENEALRLRMTFLSPLGWVRSALLRMGFGRR